jgi:uncharacterized membrane protein
MTDSTFWRTEVWHPLSVHFPIALLLFATVAKVVAMFLSPSSSFFWRKMGSFMLYIGCLSAWISVYTGGLADGIVARKICDPTVLKDHEIATYNLSYIFSAAAVLDLALLLNLIPIKQKLISGLILILMLVGTGYLVYGSHLGARVVYEQAGGVNVPSVNCAEFE